MELAPYIEGLRRDLAVAAAAGGDDARELADRLSAPLESAAVVMLLEALSAAADEITADLAPGSVEVRLRGRTPTFVVTPPPAGQDAGDGFGEDVAERTARGPAVVSDDSGTARFNLRLPESLKVRAEEAAAQAGESLNTWLVRAAAAALQPDRMSRPPERRPPHGGDRFTGWVR